MKVPHGKIIYVGTRKYLAGEEIPDDLIKDLEKQPAKPPRIPKPKSTSDIKPTVKP